MARKLIWTLLTLVVSIGAFFLGTRIGVQEFTKSNAQYNAALIAYELTNLKTEKRNEILGTKEILLNSELANHGDYMKSPLKWLWYSPYRDDKPIKFAATYRKNNPFEPPITSDQTKWKNTDQFTAEELDEMAQLQKEGEEEIQRLVKLVVQAYAE